MVEESEPDFEEHSEQVNLNDFGETFENLTNSMKTIQKFTPVMESGVEVIGTQIKNEDAKKKLDEQKPPEVSFDAFMTDDLV